MDNEQYAAYIRYEWLLKTLCALLLSILRVSCVRGLPPTPLFYCNANYQKSVFAGGYWGTYVHFLIVLSGVVGELFILYPIVYSDWLVDC